jgi:hypothetical protein
VTVHLPPFPVDDATLDLLDAALDPWANGDPTAEHSSLWDLLTLLSEMGGSDPRAVAEVHDDGSDGGPSIVKMRDPIYTDHAVISALIAEVRRLRGLLKETPSGKAPSIE